MPHVLKVSQKKKEHNIKKRERRKHHLLCRPPSSSISQSSPSTTTTITTTTRRKAEDTALFGSAMPDVGVSLALKQQKRLLQTSPEDRTKRKDNRTTSSAGPSSPVEQRSKAKKESKIPTSLEVFLEGASIYALCLFLPSILGQILYWYKSSWATNGILKQLAIRACTSPIFAHLQWCIRNTGNGDSASVLAPDAGISDVAIVSTLCLIMAMIRLTLVHFLVPNYNQPKRLEALVRCKSISLLSSAYPGSVTPRSSQKGKPLKVDTQNLLLAIPPMPSGELPDSKVEPKRLFGSSSDLKRNHREGEANDTSNAKWDLSNVGMSFDDDDEPKHYSSSEDGIHDDMSTAPAVSSGLMTSSSALSLQNLLHQATPRTPTSRQIAKSEEDTDRMFAAPKYATACFRMLFCSVSCTIALVYFGDSDFWPPAVGGHGSTKNCWDLSSVGAAVMESDFDDHNTVLRRYYLVQLSYHFHSGAFHILAALLLWLVSASKSKQKDQKKYLGLVPASLFTLPNLQSLFQHCFAVGIMTFSYLFSSLRRLGAIAMFAFDLSSWFLHLLQMSINVPWNERRISPFWIKILHRLFVIPTFCYSRFYIFPFVIGFSALEESQDWLRQLENMLYPGISDTVHNFFVVSFCLFMIINLIYARRLFYHSHVKEASDRPTSKRGDKK